MPASRVIPRRALRPRPPVAPHPALECAELLEADRPARAARRGADLGPEAELAGVGELGFAHRFARREGRARSVMELTARLTRSCDKGGMSAAWRIGLHGAFSRRSRLQVSEGTMQNLLILLVVLTMACGAAASVTVSLAPAYADDSGKGY
jgi:hypothetical protein